MQKSNSQSGPVNRRTFLECSARNAAGIAAGAISLGAAKSPTDPIRLGVIGVGSQGLELARTAAMAPQTEVAAICDVDARSLAIAQQDLSRLQETKPVIVTDHQSLVSRDEIDAIIVATPDHWHKETGLAVLQSGKDLFLETPVAHTIAEGEEIAEAAAAAKRIVQVGLPQRSGAHFQSAVKLIQSGLLGKVHQAKAWAVHRRKSIGNCASSRVPMGVDYERWLGPAPHREFQANRFHGHWPWYWDYGSGELGLWGVHQLDVIRWALSLELPQQVFATGGKHSLRDDRETPDTLTVHYDYPGVDVVWEHRQWSNRGIEGRSSGVAFYGDLGTLVLDRSGWKLYDHHEERHAQASEIKQTQMNNFLQSVRFRTPPIVDIQEGQMSTILCHLGNMAYLQGRVLQFDSTNRVCPNV